MTRTFVYVAVFVVACAAGNYVGNEIRRSPEIKAEHPSTWRHH